MGKIVVGLDLSTKTGYSVFEDGKLIDYGLITLPDDLKSDCKHPNYPYNFINSCEYLADQIRNNVLIANIPDRIIIEETCCSRNVFAQKQIEWLHFCLLNKIEELSWNPKVFYLGSNKWRSILKIIQTKETKKKNKLVREGKAKGVIRNKHLSVWKINAVYELGFLMKHENEADAIHLAAAHLQQHGELKHDYSKPLQSIEDR